MTWKARWLPPFTVGRTCARSKETTTAISARTVDLVTALRRQASLTTRDTGEVPGLTGSRINQLEHTLKTEQEPHR